MTTNRRREGHLICKWFAYFLAELFFDVCLPVICDGCKPLVLLLANNHATAPWTSMLRPHPSPTSRVLLKVWYHPVSAQRVHHPFWSPPSLNYHLFPLSQCHLHGIQSLRTHTITITTTPNKMVYHRHLLTELQGPLNSMATCIHIPKISQNMRNDPTPLLRSILSVHIHCTTGHTSSTNYYQYLFLPRFPLCPIIIDLAGWKKLHPETLSCSLLLCSLTLFTPSHPAFTNLPSWPI